MTYGNYHCHCSTSSEIMNICPLLTSTSWKLCDLRGHLKDFEGGYGGVGGCLCVVNKYCLYFCVRVSSFPTKMFKKAIVPTYLKCNRFAFMSSGCIALSHPVPNHICITSCNNLTIPVIKKIASNCVFLDRKKLWGQ